MKTLVGSVWDPAMVPLALAMIAAVILTLAVQPVARRILGAVVALLAAVASFRSVMLLTSDVDLARAKSILTSGSATQRATKPVQISDWAQVTDAHVHTMPVLLALVAAALGVIGGVLLMMQPGKASKGTLAMRPRRTVDPVPKRISPKTQITRVRCGTLWTRGGSNR